MIHRQTKKQFPRNDPGIQWQNSSRWYFCRFWNRSLVILGTRRIWAGSALPPSQLPRRIPSSLTSLYLLSECTMCALHQGSAGPPFQTTGLPLRVRRSAVACITCRRRKIRCDVTISGTPCTNCRLDNDQCVTVNQKRPRKAKNAAVPSAQDSQALASLPLVTNTAVPPWSAIDYTVSVQENSSVHSAWPPLLSAETRWLPPNDVAYLTSQQALTLPKKAIIHTLLQYYFLHVHPCFPVVKESEFRDGSLHQTPFSLLVFRSMLFAAACVHPPYLTPT